MNKSIKFKEQKISTRIGKQNKKLQILPPNTKTWKTVCKDDNCLLIAHKEGFCKEHLKPLKNYILKNIFKPKGIEFKKTKSTTIEEIKNIMRKLYYKDDKNNGNIEYITWEFLNKNNASNLYTFFSNYTRKDKKINIKTIKKYSSKIIGIACYIIPEKTEENHITDYEKFLNKRKKWTEEKIYRFFYKILICNDTNLKEKFENILQFLSLDDIKNLIKAIYHNTNIQLPKYTWCQEHYSDFIGALNSYKISWQTLLKSVNLSNRRKNNYSETDLINELQTIYDNEGFPGLVRVNLDNKHGGMYNSFIRKKEDENQKRFLPSIWCCQKLNIEEEMKVYNKTINPHLCNFEELMDIHLKPLLPDLVKKNGIYGSTITDRDLSENNHCDIVNRYRKLKKNINDVRIYCNLTHAKGKYLTMDKKLICDSRAEMAFYNFLLLKNINFDCGKIDHSVKYIDINFDIKYQTFPGKHTCDFKISLPNNKNLYIEIWRFKPTLKKTYKNYQKYIDERKLKENFFKEHCNKNKNDLFLGIEWDDCKENILYEKLESYILLNDNNTIEYPLNITKTRYDIWLETFKTYQQTQPDKILPSIHDLPNSQYKYAVYSIFKKMDNLRELLGENIKISKKILKQRIKDGLKIPIPDTNEYQNLLKKLKKIKKKNNNELPSIKNLPLGYETKIYRLFSKYGGYNRVRIELGEDLKELRKKRGKHLSNLRKGNPKYMGKNNYMYGKRGKNCPTYGKKFDQTKRYKKHILTGIEFLQHFEEKINININGHLYTTWAKEEKKPQMPWKNRTEHNPWKESGFIGFIENCYEYAQKNDIKLKELNYKSKSRNRKNGLSIEQKIDEFLQTMNKRNNLMTKKEKLKFSDGINIFEFWRNCKRYLKCEKEHYSKLLENELLKNDYEKFKKNNTNTE